jgi:hypothetical protein
MSLDESLSSSPQSISSAELATCIKVLSKFNANDGYPSIESDEYDNNPRCKSIFTNVEAYCI